MAILVLFVLGTIFSIKKKNWASLLLVLGILVLGTGMTIITVGGAKYHFPYLPIFFMMAAVYVDHHFTIKMNKKIDAGTEVNGSFVEM